jgi:molybdate transport system substrate-binding protein
MSIGRRSAALGFALASLVATGVAAAEIRVLSIPFKAPLDEIGPAFERESGHTLAITYAPSEPLMKRLESGEPFDVALTFPRLVDALIAQGRVVAGSRRDIARAGLGVAVRRGAARPDLRSVEDFKQVLLRAGSIAYAAQGPSGVHLASLLDRLGVAAEIRPKLRPMKAGSLVAGPVAGGEAEIAIVSVPFILAEPGVELAGALPPELQDYVHYASGVGSAARDADAAQAFVAYLRQARSTGILKSHGLEAGPE